ncbi:MAG: anhydro-N-acetylmuramic acid kinase [Bacteroidales bacterium]|nr:anhydro-N-acetylmuramic acid kinase [Bacteroidales bacterium]MDD4209467.1 anhydro-N-acetylmuramic acid kinase [Bacteroidales bacterium]
MKTNIIGIMSGTSLDGVDIAYCTFEKTKNKWHYDIVSAETYPYSDEWSSRLQHLEHADAFTFALTDSEYGHLLGQLAKSFIEKKHVKPDYIASHGHTIFHQPEKGFTKQIGSGAAIAAECGITTICDFRSLDVALGGQGAPLVPIGDELLFGNYDACLNIGGFANISYNINNVRVAFDISPANIILNYFANKKGLNYDDNGILAKQGCLHKKLFTHLNSLNYYSNSYPKSLGKEWVFEIMLPLFTHFQLSPEDNLRTVIEHIAFQISEIINNTNIKEIFISGGGAKNNFLIERMQYYMPTINTVIPNNLFIDFKEALIFAFLGLMRINQKNNCLQSVTGAVNNNCGGCVYHI